MMRSELGLVAMAYRQKAYHTNKRNMNKNTNYKEALLEIPPKNDLCAWLEKIVIWNGQSKIPNKFIQFQKSHKIHLLLWRKS